VNILQKLLKSKKEIDPEVQEGEEIEKSFDDAMDDVKKLTKSEDENDDEGGDDTDSKKPWKKGKKKKKMDDDDDDDDDEDDDMEKSEDLEFDYEEALAKSESDLEDGEELFVDAEPIIKSMMSPIIKGLNALNKRIDSIEAISKAHAELSIGSAKIMKSLGDFSGKPAPRKGITSVERTFTKSEGDQTRTLSKAEATKKLDSLIKSGAVTSMEVGVIEGRIHKGLELPDIMFSESK
jgi:hypothetical protein